VSLWQCGGMKSLLAVLLLALPVAAADPSDVVRKLYEQVIAHKPLGVPEGQAKAAIWPLLTPRLVKQLETVAACEADYFRQHPPGDEKPEFFWLESGLFSGDNEMALPAAIEILSTEAAGTDRHRITVRFTYQESFETRGRAPDPAASFQWRSAVVVDCSKERCLVDDFIPFDIDTAKPLTPLSQSFASCKDGKWIGNRPRK
jgi:hypothetical protein